MEFKNDYERLCYQFVVSQNTATELYYSIFEKLEEHFEAHLSTKYKHRFVSNRKEKRSIELRMAEERKKFKDKKKRFQKINKEFLDSFDGYHTKFKEKMNNDVDGLFNYLEELTK